MCRYTISEKYQLPWFRKLPPKLKALHDFIVCSCDHAGVIELDFDLVSFVIGETITAEDMASFGDKLKVLDAGKYLLTDFLPDQYKTVDANCNAHIPVIRAIQKHGIECKIANLNGKPKPPKPEKPKDKTQLEFDAAMLVECGCANAAIVEEWLLFRAYRAERATAPMRGEKKVLWTKLAAEGVARKLLEWESAFGAEITIDALRTAREKRYISPVEPTLKRGRKKQDESQPSFFA